MSEWRVGRKVPINVYDGDRPVCQCHNEEDACFIVAAVNAAMADEKMFERAENEELTDLGSHIIPDAEREERLRKLWAVVRPHVESTCEQQCDAIDSLLKAQKAPH